VVHTSIAFEEVQKSAKGNRLYFRHTWTQILILKINCSHVPRPKQIYSGRTFIDQEIFQIQISPRFFAEQICDCMKAKWTRWTTESRFVAQKLRFT